jgi:predicted RNA-binding protein with TRAM domain
MSQLLVNTGDTITVKIFDVTSSPPSEPNSVKSFTVIVKMAVSPSAGQKIGDPIDRFQLTYSPPPPPQPQGVSTAFRGSFPVWLPEAAVKVMSPGRYLLSFLVQAGASGRQHPHFRRGSRNGRGGELTYGWSSATASTVGPDSPTISDSLRQPPTTSKPWTQAGSTLAHALQKAFATKRRTIMTTSRNYIWELGIDWDLIPNPGVNASYLPAAFVQPASDGGVPVIKRPNVKFGDTITFLIFDVTETSAVTEIHSFTINAQPAILMSNSNDPLSPLQPAVMPAPITPPTAPARQQSTFFEGSFPCWTAKVDVTESVAPGTPDKKYLVNFFVQAAGPAGSMSRTFVIDPEMVVGEN